MNGFRNEKHDKLFLFTMKSEFLQVLETIETSMPKGSSHVIILETFSVLGASLVGRLIHSFWRFWVIVQHRCFPIVQNRANTNNKYRRKYQYYFPPKIPLIITAENTSIYSKTFIHLYIYINDIYIYMDGWMDMPSRGEPRWDASPGRAARIRYRGCRWAERRQLSAPVHPTPPWYSDSRCPAWGRIPASFAPGRHIHPSIYIYILYRPKRGGRKPRFWWHLYCNIYPAEKSLKKSKQNSILKHEFITFTNGPQR